MKLKLILLLALIFSTGHLSATETKNKKPQISAAKSVSIATQDEFFAAFAKLCGQAFAGKVSVDNSDDSSFANKALVMHVRHCSDDEIQIPFHVGDDASRTWILRTTGSGLSLKHDHRHADGSHDAMTMYGGHTLDGGWPQAQSFPADQYSKDIFVAQGIPQSAGNTWQMFIYPKQYSYRLIRQGREFRVDFDLTKAVKAPPAPWGYKD